MVGCFHAGQASDAKMKAVTLKSPAKINLFLEVTGKRKDGYHLLETLFAKIDLCDIITVARTGREGAVVLSVSAVAGIKLSSGSDNLAVRAAEKFRTEFGITEGLRITLKKKIPIGAGLGGGSSNAASTLLALAKLFKAGKKSPKWKKILNIAAGLGADVPFFMREETFCIGKGIGEKLTPLRPGGALPQVVLVYPGAPSYTSEVYKRLALPDRKTVLTSRLSLHKLILGLKNGKPLLGWRQFLMNRLESAVLPYNGPVRKLKEDLLKAGAPVVLMSGSGSAVFSLVPGVSRAEGLSVKIRGKGRKVFTGRFFRG